MAELFLSYAAEQMLKRVQSVVTDTITGAWGLKDDLQKLSDAIGRLQSLLQKAQSVPAVEDDESIKRWLEKLQKVVYAAADVLDEFHYEILRRQVEVEGQLKRRLREFVSCNNPILFRVNMAAKVKEVRASVADVEKEAPLVLQTITIPAIPVFAERGVVLFSQPDRMTDSFPGKSERPIGRTDDVERIIKMLQVSSVGDAPQLTVISIIGFGGLGKTTLAKLVFEEAEKNKLFNEMIWVCVSEPFDIQKILGEMLQKLDQTTGGLSNIDVIVRTLRQQLKAKRLLLVLDDVWNKESAKWDELKKRLEIICGESGNFVIATTRSSEVANIMVSQHMVELQQLSDTECWCIIKEMVAGNEGKSIISNDMETIGKEIAKKCGGVPLAAKVVGGLLSYRKNKAEWLFIQHSHVWNEVDKEKRILGILKLSFDHLPQPQKLCFAYCSLFPKDVVFDKAQLIQLWMAEDFLNTTIANGGTRSKLMEDVGEEYFHSLLANSILQDAQVDEFGNFVGCKMHDLLHDLALSISKSQRLQCGSNCIETSDGSRVKCSCDQDSIVKKILEKSEDKTRYLRCLFCRVDVSPRLCNFRSLRSLDISDAKLKNLPAAIGKLKHLRYLDISKNEIIQELPASITKLYNLQTLRVFECKSLKKLPSKIMNLVSLRHVGFDDKRLMPLKVGCLTNLQTLPFFVVGAQKGQTIDELEELNELRGELVVCGLENVRDKGEAERAKIKVKKLSKLGLQWMELEEIEVNNFPASREGNHEEVMEAVEAPTEIQRLTIEWYMGKQFPQWMCQSSELVRLALNDCRRCVRMPTLGHLPNLKVLKVERMDCIKSIGSEFYGESNNVDALFPLLEELSIREMKSLVEWATPKGTEIFPMLRRLDITYCPELTSFPLSESTSSAVHMKLRRLTLGRVSMNILCFVGFKSLEALRIWNCRKLTFLHIDLTSLVDINVSWWQEEWVQSLSRCSNELGGDWGYVSIKGSVEIIREFPKSLEALEIEDLDNELSVEAFHGLSCLKYLVMTQCDVVDSIPALSSLNSLKYLEINGAGSIPTLSSLTSLKHLEINGADSIPNISFPTSLQTLRLGKCSNLALNSNSLSTLTCLEELSIWDCRNLRSLPGGIKLCTSLKKLKVTKCRETVSIDDDIIGSLTQLKELKWGGFSEELDAVPGLNSIHLLTSLQNLTINGWDKLTSLPHQLQHLLSITELKIWNFHRVESLPDWLCNLLSLETLSIHYCQKLKNLPTDMQCLSKLNSLDIISCPFLKERCNRDIGPEWSNISHITYIEIDSQVKQDLRCGTNAQVSVERSLHLTLIFPSFAPYLHIYWYLLIHWKNQTTIINSNLFNFNIIFVLIFPTLISLVWFCVME